jgi:hypothetical protein
MPQLIPVHLERFKPHLPLIVLLACLAVAFVVRYITVAHYLDMGQDIANYLVTMNTVFGDDVVGMGLLRPPFIAIPLKLFTLVFGTITGAKVLGVLVSVAIGVPFYLLARRICHPWIAVAVSVMFVFSSAYSDMLGWGYITMIGIFFILLTLHFFLLVLEKPSAGNVILTGLFASLIVASHQACFLSFVVLIILFLVALLAFNRKQLLGNYKPLAAIAAIGCLFSLPYVPIYVHLLRMQAVGGTGFTMSFTPLGQIERVFSFFGFPPGAWFWGICFVLAIAGLILLWRRDKNMALLLAVMLLLPFILAAFGLPPPISELVRRAGYMIFIPMWLLVGVTLSWLWQNLRLLGLRRWLAKAIPVALIAALLPIEIVSSQGVLYWALDFFAYLDDTRLGAIHWIAQETAPEAIIVAYPHTLGWWIGGEAGRNAFELLDRNWQPYKFQRERSLVADQILSRNQGLENGNLRLAMTYHPDYPDINAPGNPVLGVYVGGMYYDVLMFDDRQNRFEVEGGGNTTLADAQSKMMNMTGDGESMQAATLYQMEGFNVTRTVILNRGKRAATIRYQIHSGGANITKFDVPVLFTFQPSTPISQDGHSFEVKYELMTSMVGMVPVTTNVTVETAGATLEMGPLPLEQGMICSFCIIGSEATVTFQLSTDKPLSPVDAPVSHYEVPKLLKDYGVDYVAMDLKPPLFSDMPRGTEEWFDNCPYYELVYSQGDIRIYRVNTSALIGQAANW